MNESNYVVRPLVGFMWKAPRRKNAKGSTWSRAPRRALSGEPFRPDPVPMASRAAAPFLVALSGWNPARVEVEKHFSDGSYGW